MALPRLVVELKPRPGASSIARNMLDRPHIIEGGACFGAQNAACSVVIYENKRVQNRFSASRFCCLVLTIAGISIVRLNILPEAYPRFDVVYEFVFEWRRVRSPKRGAKSRARQRVG